MAWAGFEVLQYAPSNPVCGATARDRYVVVNDRDTGLFTVFDVQTRTARQFTGLGTRGYQMSTSVDGQSVWHAGRDQQGNLRLSLVDPANGNIMYWTGPTVADVTIGCVDAGDLVWLWYTPNPYTPNQTGISKLWYLTVFDKTSEVFSVVDTVTEPGVNYRPYVWVYDNIVYWTETNRRYNATTAAALSPTANVVRSSRANAPHDQPHADGVAWWFDQLAPYTGGHIVGMHLPSNTIIAAQLASPIAVGGAALQRVGSHVYVTTNNSGNLMGAYNINTGIYGTQSLPTFRRRALIYYAGGELVIPSAEPGSW